MRHQFSRVREQPKYRVEDDAEIRNRASCRRKAGETGSSDVYPSESGRVERGITWLLEPRITPEYRFNPSFYPVNHCYKWIGLLTDVSWYFFAIKMNPSKQNPNRTPAIQKHASQLINQYVPPNLRTPKRPRTIGGNQITFVTYVYLLSNVPLIYIGGVRIDFEGSVKKWKASEDIWKTHKKHHCLQ